jgi:hypothetical protein
VQELHDQINVGQDHASAAVALASKLVKRISWGHAFFVNQVEVPIPFVAGDLSMKNQFRVSKLTLPHVKHLTGMIILTLIIY